MKDNATEILIWKYIDGECTPEEINQVEKRMAEDAEFKSAFLERKQLHEGMQEMEPEQPSMRFTQNLMEKLPELYLKFSVAPLIGARWARAIAGGLTLICIGFYALISFAVPAASGGTPTTQGYTEATETINNFFQSVPSQLFLILGALSFGYIALVFIDQKLRERFSKIKPRT